MYQSDFRTNYSTDLCLAQLTDFVATDKDKQKYTAMILADIQKTFGSLEHGVFLDKKKKKKKKYFGFQTSVIKLFESYLSNRKLLVCIDSVFSEAGTLK